MANVSVSADHEDNIGIHRVSLADWKRLRRQLVNVRLNNKRIEYGKVLRYHTADLLIGKVHIDIFTEYLNND